MDTPKGIITVSSVVPLPASHGQNLPAIILALLLALVTSSVAQIDPAAGVVPFSTRDENPYDSIDLASSNIMITIPVRAKVGKTPFVFRLVANSHAFLSSTHTNIFIDSGFNGQPFVMDLGARLTFTSSQGPLCNGFADEIQTNFAVVDSTGASHPLSKSVETDTKGCMALPVPQGTTDDSGYNVDFIAQGDPPNTVITDRYGNTVSYSAATFTTTATDPDGVQASWTNGSPSVYTDTLGQKFLTTVWTQTSTSYQYTDVLGKTQKVTVNSSPFTQRTHFACANISDYGPYSVYLPTNIVLADGGQMNISYETTPDYSGDTTGRITKLTLPSGGSITYAYSGGNNNTGLDCNSGVVPTLTRTVNDNNGNTSPWKYVNTVSTVNPTSTVVVTDPSNNTITYNFVGEFQTQKQVVDVKNGLLSKTVTCYNKSFSNCASLSVIPSTITQTDVYTYLNGSSQPSLVETINDIYGNVTAVKNWGFGATYPPSGTPLSETDTAYAIDGGISCGSGGIVALPCTVTTYGSGTKIQQVSYTYQAGHPTQTSTWVSGSTSLTSSATYNSNGTIATFQDVSYPTTNATTTYSYNGSGGCNNLLPTSATVTGLGLPSGGLTTSQQWNCDGGVLTQSTDANNQITHYKYDAYVNQQDVGDPLWRQLSVTDPLNNTASTNYSPGATIPMTVETVLSLSSSSSVDKLTTYDGLARPILAQTLQAPGSSYFDTVVTSFDLNGRISSVGLACVSSAASKPCTPSGALATSYDALNRPLQYADSGGGTVTHTYNQNDDLVVTGPNPTGENLKQFQNQYDGLGRLTQSCAIGNGVTTGCAQTTGSANGLTTSFTYTYPNTGTQIGEVQSTRGVQNRNTFYDGVGRVTQVSTPEGGAWQYFYDSYASCPSGYQGVNGQRAASKDPNGNLICYSYDSLNRVTGTNANGTTCRHFYYDGSTGYSGSIPSGVSTPTYSNGRMVEAATDQCMSGTLITDEWFSYDQDGHPTDTWQSSPHSTQYYHSTAVFAGNGAITSLQLASPSLVTMNYGLEGEGRWDTLDRVISGSTTHVVTGPTTIAGATNAGGMYDAAGHVLNVLQTGTTPDQDIYKYDPNTGRMTSFEFEVGNTSANLTGTLHWNANGTLGYLQIVDGFNSGGSQTCYSNSSSAVGYGYDDWGRLVAFDCPGGSANWGQEFSYDLYDNLTQTIITGRNGRTWNPGYNTSNNQVSGATYDANGNMTNSGSNTFGWNEFSKMKWAASSGTPTCGTSGQCITYDAFGRIVEISNGSNYKEWWYTQVPGSMVGMIGATLGYAYWPSPGRGTFVENGEFLHQDWLGNDRIVSDIGNHTVSADRAYTPYGSQYNTYGSSNPVYGMFAGITGDFDSGALYDTPNREFAQSQGRWISPDPLGMGAVDPTNPQNWNRYAYVTNPLSNIDPSGLECVWEDGSWDGPDDPKTGNGQKCASQGGVWIEPAYFATLGLADWSSSGNSVLQGLYDEVDWGGNPLGLDSAGVNANISKLTTAQCKAAQTLLAREAQHGTSIAAFTSAIGFGDSTVQPFNSSNTAPINTPVGPIKIDWYTDIQATGPSFSFGVGNSIAYAEGKLIWTGLRLLTGAPITNYLPFTDATERNTLQQTFSPFSHYSDIFTPAFMQQNCGPQ